MLLSKKAKKPYKLSPFPSQLISFPQEEGGSKVKKEAPQEGRQVGVGDEAVTTAK